MINTKYLLCISTCLLFSGNVQASDINLTYDSSGFLPGSSSLFTLHTPSELRPTSSFNIDNAVKLAAVCSVGGGGCNGLSFGSSDNSMNLNKSSQCEDDGYVRSCPAGEVRDENSLCPHDKSYFKCRKAVNSCDDGYSQTACNTSTQVQTASYKNEAGNTCYQCRNKTCAEGGYTASITSCQNGTTVTFANQTCYSNVSAKTCENGGYKSSIPTNNKCDSTTYCSKTCYTNCKQPTCEESGYLSSCPSNHDCTTVTTGTYGRTCYNDGGQPTCETGNYKSGIPTNYVCTPVTYYGRTCYKDCYQPQCSAGGYVDACPTNQIGTSVAYYGRNCLKDCYQPQCAAGGYVDTCPTGQSGTAVTYYGRTCYKGCAADEVEIVCKFGSILYSDLKCYSKTQKTPIGVVIDNLGKRALALDEVAVTSKNPATIETFIKDLYAENYSKAGVSGWSYATANDLDIMRENVETLNTILASISGASKLDTTNEGYIGGEARFLEAYDYFENVEFVEERVNRCMGETICLVAVNTNFDMSGHDFKIRLVLFYGDCGSYNSSIPSNKKCTSIIYNGNTCYKDCRDYTCSDGGFQSNNKFQCSTGTLKSVSYHGLTCYHCTGTSTPTLAKDCYIAGSQYFDSLSEESCNCPYGVIGDIVTTASGSKTCYRCGLYSECYKNGAQMCLMCDKNLAPIQDYCNGGERGSTCACGGIHTERMAAAHYCSIQGTNPW